MNQMSQASAAVAYVRFVLDELKLSASGLAKGAGLASTTITRALNDPDHRFELSMSTLKKIAAFSGISPTPFFQAKDFADLSMVPFTQPNLYDESWGAGANPSAEDPDYEMILIIGTAEFGVYRPPELRRIEDAAPFGIKLYRVKHTDAFALEMADESASRVIPQGFYALCVRGTEFGHGDLVVVERWTADRKLMELSVRRLVIPEIGSPYLRLDSADERYAEKISLPHDVASDPLIRLIGTVLYAINSVRDEALNEEARLRSLARRRQTQKHDEA